MRLSYSRIAKPILIVATLLLPILGWGAWQAVQPHSNRVIDWLPKKFAATQQLFWYFDRFGSDEILAISWPGCTLDTPSVGEFAKLLLADNPVPGRSQSFFRESIDGRSVFQQLTSSPLNFRAEEAHRRMQGWILGPDNKTTCIVARIRENEDRTYSRMAAYAYVESIAQQLGISRSQLHLAGPTADSVHVDLANESNMTVLRIATAALTLLLAWLSLRDLRQVAVVTLTSNYAVVASLAAIHLLGYQMDAILLTLPPLVLVLTTSGAIHLCHYFNHESRNGSAIDATQRAMAAGWIPCCLAGLTTMAGLASMAVSGLSPIVRFAMLSAIGVGLGLICLMTLWPALACVLMRPRQKTLPAKGSQAASQTEPFRWWQPVYQISTRHWAVVLVAALVSFPVLAVGVSRINTTVSLSSLLPSDSKLLRSYAWFEQNVGPLVPVEIIVQFPDTGGDPTMALLDRAQLTERLRSAIADVPQTNGTIAATTFMPPLPDVAGVRQIMIRRVMAERLWKRRATFAEHQLISQDKDDQLWRISTRVIANRVDGAQFLADLNQTVQQILETTPLGQRTHATAQVCGSIPLIQLAQKQLLVDLFQSYLVAFSLIGVAMVIVIRNLAGGVVAMVPNVFPSLLLFGYMGYSGSLVDIGTMMTASVALGIAVDDTLHFLVWYRRSIRQGCDRAASVRSAFECSATAMLQTSVICGLGMLPVVASPFGPVSRFSFGLIVLLLAAILGDLLLLPAILASPLGVFFRSRPAVAIPAASLVVPQRSSIDNYPLTTPRDHLDT